MLKHIIKVIISNELQKLYYTALLYTLIMFIHKYY